MGRRSPSRIQSAVLLFLAVVCYACGGGGGGTLVQPAPTPDFLLAFSPGTISVPQGSTSAAVSITVTAESGFTGSVQVTLTGTPAGVTSNPASPFTVAAGGQASVIFGVAAGVATGNVAISAQGTSGTLSHSAPLTLDIVAAIAPAVARTTYTRTDATAALDDPAGEFHHRHIVYDFAHQQIFIANRTMNRVEVFSATTQARTAQIAIPGVSSVDISQDGSTVWAGSVTERVFAIDTKALQVKASFTVPPVAPIPNTVFDLPEEAIALAGGNFLLRMRQSAAPEALLALWNPATNSPKNLTSAEPQLFQNGLGAMARSGDGTHVLVAASDASGEIALFDAHGNAVVGPRGVGSGTIPQVAANADGSAYAVILIANGSPQLYLFDGSLNPIAGPVSVDVTSVVFSRDGTSLYAAQPASVLPVINVFDAHSLAPVGQIPDAAIQGVSSQLEDADATQLLFALSNRGVAFLDAAAPALLPTPAPAFAAAPASAPSEGPAAGGTSLSLSGENFTALSQVHIGTQIVANASVSSATQLQATSPPNATPGAANISAYFDNGWLALTPDAFSYGPQILQILPNAGSSAGGDAIRIYGYGFGRDATKITAQIAGANATIQSVENVTAIAPMLALDPTYPFSLECITLQTPAGAPGEADLSVSTPSGATTATKAFQFLQSVQFFAKPGLYKFIAYDQKRQRLYLSNIDHVDVFDLAGQQYLAPLEPPGGPPPDAGLRGISLSPDASQLVVADFGAQSVYLLDPDDGTGTTVPVGGVPGFLNSGPARVAATSAQTVFVGFDRRGRARRLLFVPGAAESGGKPSRLSACHAAGGHQHHWSSASASQCCGRPGFRRLWRLSGQPVGAMASFCAQSIHGLQR